MNIEATIIAHLRSCGFDAYRDIPAERPREFVTVERTGGRTGTALDRPTLAVQAWAATSYGASELMTRVDECMRASVGIDGITHAECNSICNFPDESGHPRYQAVYDLVAYL